MDRILLLSICGLAAFPAVGQEEALNLFEPTEQVEQSRNESRQPERMTARSAEPAFTLRGTTRLGDKYSATLVSRDGQAVSLDWRPGTRSQVGSYAGFSIVDIKSRSVSLELPSGESCVESKERGVTCSTNGIALLSLSRAEPMQPREPLPVPEGEGAASDVIFVSDGNQDPASVEAAEALPLNPFSGEPQVAVQLSEEERRARAERQAVRMRALQNFEPVRIPDSEVPPGMRKVSTPFGDRLVPDE